MVRCVKRATQIPGNAGRSGHATRRQLVSAGQRKGVGRSSHVLCGPAWPILAEIHQPMAPHDPRNLALVQGATMHFEQIPGEGAGTCSWILADSKRVCMSNYPARLGIALAVRIVILNNPRARCCSLWFIQRSFHLCVRNG